LLMDEILPGLFIGSIREAWDEELLKRHNIKFVVNATHRENPFPEQIEYLHCRVLDEDEENIYQYFEPARSHIVKAKEAKAACLVHCMAGISRSSTLVLCYLIMEEKMTLLDAWELLLDRRHEIQPNDGFWEQLTRLDHEQRGFHSIDLVEYKLRSLAMEFEDFVTIEEIQELYEEMDEDLEELDNYLIDKYL